MAASENLTNLELAANPTWVIASTFAECPFCGFLCRDLGLVRVSVPCPNCNRSGSARLLFPGIACIKWLEMIADSYVRAYARAGEKQAALAEQIRSDLRRRAEPSWVVAAARNVRKLLRKSRGSQAEYKRVLDALQRRLSLDSQEQARRVYPLILEYSETTNDHCNVVVSTAALFESLFSDFLVRLLVSRGRAYGEARKTVAKMRRRDDLKKLFKETTRTPLLKAVGEFGVSGLYEGWQDVATRRNRFLHITPGAISADMAEKAFNIAKNAFGLFAYLHNRFCVAASSPHKRRALSKAGREDLGYKSAALRA